MTFKGLIALLSIPLKDGIILMIFRGAFPFFQDSKDNLELNAWSHSISNILLKLRSLENLDLAWVDAKMGNPLWSYSKVLEENLVVSWEPKAFFPLLALLHTYINIFKSMF